MPVSTDLSLKASERQEQKTENNFPGAKGYPRERFTSPISRKQHADMEWQQINPHWRGYVNVNSLKEEELVMLQSLYGLKLCTNIQLAKHYLLPYKSKSQNAMKNIKNRLRKLADHGILVNHMLTLENKKVPIYTIGPAGAAVLDVPYTPNWWLEESPYIVLRQLIANQLFFRFKLTGSRVIYNPTPQPFNGEIIFKGIDFLVCITQNGNVPSELKWEDNSRIILISETVQEALAAAKKIKDDLYVRYTTDYELFTIELHKAFYKYSEKEILKPTEISGFNN